MAEIKKLSEVVEILNGYAFESKKYVEAGLRIIRIANVQDGVIVDNLPCFYPVNTDVNIEKYKLFENDLLLSLTGNVGRVGILPVHMLPAVLNQRVCCLRPKSQNVSYKYLYYYLRRRCFVEECIKASKGVAQLNLSTKWLANYPIYIPNISEQGRIVARIEELFSQLDASVAELKMAKERLKVYRQAVVTAAYPTLTAENTHCLSELAEITGGITKGRKFENSETIFLPYLRVANVQNGYLDLTEVKQIQLKKSEIEQYLLHFGDVLYTEGGDRDKLGRGTIWRNEIENCVHQNHVFKARIDSEKALPLYVAYWSMTTPARNYFYAKGKQSVNLASINKTVLSALPIPLAPIEQQKRIVTEIEDKLSVCDNIEKMVDTALQQAEALRQSILKKAFEGEI